MQFDFMWSKMVRMQEYRPWGAFEAEASSSEKSSGTMRLKRLSSSVSRKFLRFEWARKMTIILWLLLNHCLDIKISMYLIQAWLCCRDESPCLPPMCLGFDSWLKTVTGLSFLVLISAPWGFCSRYSSFLIHQTNIASDLLLSDFNFATSPK